MGRVILPSVASSVWFSAGHRLPGLESPCRYLHGHNYKWTAAVGGTLHVEGPLAGRVADAESLRQAMRAAVEKYDHRLLLWKEDPVRLPGEAELGIVRVPFLPTPDSLNINLAMDLTERGWIVYSTSLYETEEHVAVIYTAEETPAATTPPSGPAGASTLH